MYGTNRGMFGVFLSAFYCSRSLLATSHSLVTVVRPDVTQVACGPLCFFLSRPSVALTPLNKVELLRNFQPQLRRLFFSPSKPFWRSQRCRSTKKVVTSRNDSWLQAF